MKGTKDHRKFGTQSHQSDQNKDKNPINLRIIILNSSSLIQTINKHTPTKWTLHLQQKSETDHSKVEVKNKSIMDILGL